MCNEGWTHQIIIDDAFNGLIEARAMQLHYDSCFVQVDPAHPCAHTNVIIQSLRKHALRYGSSDNIPLISSNVFVICSEDYSDLLFESFADDLDMM